jgi:hypothetical protein
MPLPRVAAAQSLVCTATARTIERTRSNTGAVKSFAASCTPNTATETLVSATSLAGAKSLTRAESVAATSAGKSATRTLSTAESLAPAKALPPASTGDTAPRTLAGEAATARTRAKRVAATRTCAADAAAVGTMDRTAACGSLTGRR